MATSATESDIRGLEKLKDIYGDLCQIATPSAGRINTNGNYIEVSN